MSQELLTALRSIVRDELARLQPPEIGVVSQVHPRVGEGDAGNHQVDVRLRASGVELHRVPVTVPRLGLSALPEVGDTVLVAFVGDDLNGAVVVGCLYDDEAHPPVAAAHEVVYQPPEEEDAAVRRLHVELAGGGTLTLGDESLEIVFGDTRVVLHRDGDVEIQAAGGVTLSAGGDLKLSAGGTIEAEAQADVTLKAGAQGSFEATAQVGLKGAKVAIAGLTEFSPS